MTIVRHMQIKFMHNVLIADKILLVEKKEISEDDAITIVQVSFKFPTDQIRRALRAGNIYKLGCKNELFTTSIWVYDSDGPNNGELVIHDA